MVAPMTMTASYVRPDRVMSTGVIAPYPIRTTSPVTVARQTINPFVNEVRAVGPTRGLGSSDADARRLRAAGRRVTRGVPQMVRMGNRPIAMRNGRPRVASRAAQRVVSQTKLTGRLTYLMRAARAGHRVNQAKSRGTSWDMIHAKQHQLHALWRPGWRF
jgi:hypothetical protein